MATDDSDDDGVATPERLSDQSGTSANDPELGSKDREQQSDAPEHLTDVPDGCGCIEVWEHLSEERTEE